MERLRQAMKELEKEEQMEVMRSQRRVMVEDIVQTREQVEGQARCEKGVEWLRSRAGGGGPLPFAWLECNTLQRRRDPRLAA